MEGEAKPARQVPDERMLDGQTIDGQKSDQQQLGQQQLDRQKLNDQELGTPLMQNMDEPDGGVRPPRPEKKKDPERKCVLSGESGRKDLLIRFVMGPDGILVPDLAEKLPGRGLWVTADRELIERGLKKGQLAKEASRSFKCRVGPQQLGECLVERLDALIVRRISDRLGLLKRAGQLVSGYDKAVAALSEAGRPGVVCFMTASDAGEDGIRKLEGKLKAQGETPAVFHKLLTREALSAALGLDNAVHILVFEAGGTDRLMADLGRLQGLRGGMNAAGMSD